MSASSASYLRALAAAGAPIVGTPGPDILEGTSGDDEINGRGGDDILRGLAGNDSLDGWAGADRMEGGTGDDTYFVDNLGDVVVEAAGADGGIDIVNAAVDFTLGTGVENLRLWGAARTGIGNEFANVITGNSQANALAGGGGSDTLDGGAGDDTFFYGTASGKSVYISWDDTIEDDGSDVYRGGDGIDTYVVPTFYQDDGGWLDSWTLGLGVSVDLRSGTVAYTWPSLSDDRIISIENVATGAGDDRIVGTAGANLIDCGGGRDTVRGLGGDDTILGGAAIDSGSDPDRSVMQTLDGGAGNDVIDSGGSYWEEFDARSFSHGFTTDRLLGGAGRDHLIGGIGHVAMTGGKGADVFEARVDTYVVREYNGFVYGAEASAVSITDFNASAGDRIVIRCGLDGNDDEDPGTIPTPIFVGMDAHPDVGEIAYTRERQSDGSVDTMLTFRYLFDSAGYNDPSDLDFHITLENYKGSVSADMIEFI